MFDFELFNTEKYLRAKESAFDDKSFVDNC